jgi:hypothetical protein
MALEAQTLFEGVFPRILMAKKSLVGSVDGTVMFTVTGDDGGVWTLDLRKKGARSARPGPIENPDVTITMKSSFVETFFGGNYDGAKAIKDGDLAISGSQKVLNAFISMLAAKAQKPMAALKKPEAKAASVSVRKRR